MNSKRFPLFIARLMILLSSFYWGIRSIFNLPGYSLIPFTAGQEPVDNSCCRGKEHLYLWGPHVVLSDRKNFTTAYECCMACKKLCRDDDCRCNAWVFCGNRNHCGDKFGQCWLNRQRNILLPSLDEKGIHYKWTSGIVFGKGKGTIAMKTEYGKLRMKLLPEYAPESVLYVLDIFGRKSCSYCFFKRIEGQPSENSIATFAPKYAFLKGILEDDAHHSDLGIPTESGFNMTAGSVGWASRGPEFLICLVDFIKLEQPFTIFGVIPPEDLPVARKIASILLENTFSPKEIVAFELEEAQ